MAAQKGPGSELHAGGGAANEADDAAAAEAAREGIPQSRGGSGLERAEGGPREGARVRGAAGPRCTSRALRRERAARPGSATEPSARAAAVLVARLVRRTNGMKGHLDSLCSLS